MNKLQRIEEMEKQLAALKAEVEQESKVEKWEPKGGKWTINCTGEVVSVSSWNDSRKFGTERQTREAAERARDKMRVFNRLLAYVDEFAPGYEFEPGVSAAIIKKDRGYDVATNVTVVSPVGISMPQDVAMELCRKLNSGEVVL